MSEEKETFRDDEQDREKENRRDEEQASGGEGCAFRIKFEDVDDGYRVTVTGLDEQVRRSRTARRSLLRFLRDAKRACWGWLFPWRCLFGPRRDC